MSKADIIRAWKDEQYRKSLSPEEQSALPENPAGQIELGIDELSQVNGGNSWGLFSAGCCSHDILNCNSTVLGGTSVLITTCAF